MSYFIDILNKGLEILKSKTPAEISKENKSELVVPQVQSLPVATNPNSTITKEDSKAAELVTKFEGFFSDAYPDPGSKDGLPITIGYGSTRWEDGSLIKLGQKITKEHAIALRNLEINDTMKFVNSVIKVPLNQKEFDAIVSFTYNVGNGALKSSTMLKRINNKEDKILIAKEFLKWTKNDGKVMLGLVRRRLVESLYFLGKSNYLKGFDCKTTSPKLEDYL